MKYIKYFEDNNITHSFKPKAVFGPTHYRKPVSIPQQILDTYPNNEIFTNISDCIIAVKGIIAEEKNEGYLDITKFDQEDFIRYFTADFKEDLYEEGFTLLEDILDYFDAYLKFLGI